MSNTIYQKSSGFLQKEAEIKVLGEFNGSWKEIGKAVVNLSEYIDTPVKEHVFPLQKCQEKDAALCLSISTDSSKVEESKHQEQNTDDLVRQLNDSKNKLAALRDNYDEVFNQKESLRGELVAAQQELMLMRASNEENPALLEVEK